MVTVSDVSNVALAICAIASFAWAIVEKRGRGKEREAAKAAGDQLVGNLFKNVDGLTKDIQDARKEARDATIAAGEAMGVAGVAKAEADAAKTMADALRAEVSYWRSQADHWQKQAGDWQSQYEREVKNNLQLRGDVEAVKDRVSLIERPSPT